jgi:hypothetical protein
VFSDQKSLFSGAHPITLTHETHEMTRKEETTELIFASEILVFFRLFRGQMDS